jgi:hypothetical protein
MRRRERTLYMRRVVQLIGETSLEPNHKSMAAKGRNAGINAPVTRILLNWNYLE